MMGKLWESSIPQHTTKDDITNTHFGTESSILQTSIIVFFFSLKVSLAKMIVILLCIAMYCYVGVSKNRGYPQIIPCLIGFSIIFTIHFGVPLFLEGHPCIVML